MEIYSKVDLIRAVKLAREKPELNGANFVKAFDELYPRLTAKEKLQNLANALGMSLNELRLRIDNLN